MTGEIPVTTSPAELTSSVLEIRKLEKPGVVMCDLGGGILRFAGAAFPEIDSDKVYAQSNNREPEGRGAHFDVYGSFLDDDYPWLGLFNLAGRAALRTVDLPDDLAKVYEDMYPTPTDEAFEARRHFSAIALGYSEAEIGTGTLDAGIGLIIPQKVTGPHIVHDIVPEDSENPGKFVKLIVPNKSKETSDRMAAGGYKPLDELLSEGLLLAPAAETVETSDDIDKPLGLGVPIRTRVRTGRTGRGISIPSIRTPRPPRTYDDDEPYRRPCNLD